MEKERVHIFRMVMLAMMVAIGVVISPILRIEGMCPTAHLINIVCSVLMGPWYSLLCATLIGDSAPCIDGGCVWCLFIRCFLSVIGRQDYLCCSGRDFRNRYHWLDGLLSGDGIFDGQGRIECVFLYANVYRGNSHGRNGGLYFPESIE